MPRVAFTLRWPDGSEQPCESPSTAIERWLVDGAVYPVEELLRRVAEGMAAASERVRERFGVACTAAAAQREAIESAAAAYAPDGAVRIDGMQREVHRARFAPAVRLSGDHEVVVVGGGQAGLSLSYCLAERGIEHIVLERHRVCHAWRTARWDSFCLVTPNWQCRLPGHPYRGDDPDGFMVGEEIVEYLDSYLDAFDPPVLEDVTVRGVSRTSDGFRVATSRGTLTARHVVLAVGGYHRPVLPQLAKTVPAEVTQLHSSAYRNPSSLPDGDVLVVGSGQSGAQIAEDLLLAGRRVHLAVGTAPRVARFYRGRDCVAWLEEMGHYDMAIEDHPEGRAARKEPNHYVTGRDGGRDIDLRAHARQGMVLHGRLLEVDAGGPLRFADDLRANLDAADATAERIKDAIDTWIEAHGIDAPEEARYRPVWEPTFDSGDGDGDGGNGRDDAAGDDELTLGAGGVRSIVWATGFHMDWSWVDAPRAFDADGRPDHVRGVSGESGLAFLGLPWLHTWGSGRFASIGRDAAFLADHIEAALAEGRAGLTAAS